MILPPTFTSDGKNIHVVIETPRGNSNKFTYIPGNDFFKITKALPAGMVFPWDFGFIPGTKGEDGDPLDVLVLMGPGACTGCVVECRLAGVITAEQTQKGHTERNDRIIAISNEHDAYAHMHSIHDINKNFIDEIGSFFRNYNALAGNKFEVLGIEGPAKTWALIKEQQAQTKQD